MVSKSQMMFAILIVPVAFTSSCRTPSASGSETNGVRTSAQVQGVDGNAQINVAPPEPQLMTYANFKGSDAKSVYESMKSKENNSAGELHKKEEGRLFLKCEETGLAPGAQGYPGPSKYNCIVRTLGAEDLTTGARVPSPELPPFLDGDDTDASRSLAMNLQNVSYDWDEPSSRYVATLDLTEASFSCSVKVQGVNKFYSCNVSGKTAR